MQLAGSSWRISEDRWPESFERALWFPAAERIDVATAGVVPGLADVEPLPDPSTDPPNAAEQCLACWPGWHSLVEPPQAVATVRPFQPPAGLPFSPPGFPGLAGWPALQRVVNTRPDDYWAV